MMKRLDPRLRSKSPTTNRDAHLTPIFRIYISRSARWWNAIATSKFEDSQRYDWSKRNLTRCFLPTTCIMYKRRTRNTKNKDMRTWNREMILLNEDAGALSFWPKHYSSWKRQDDFQLRRSRGRFTTCVLFILYAECSVSVAPVFLR